MNISIKQRIYWSFSLLVLLFVINGIASIVTLNNNKKLGDEINKVITPALYAAGNFEDLLTQSKISTTSWVFLRSNQEDKDALINLHKVDYPELKKNLHLLFSVLNEKSLTDSIDKACKGFEELLDIEQKIMTSLRTFEDYDDPVKKFDAERLVEDELLPRTAALMSSLDTSVSYMQDTITDMNNSLDRSFVFLRMLTVVLAIIIICLGVFLSFYMTKIIISPIHKIRHIVNDLGKGIIRQINHKSSKDEIGDMVRSINSLSNRLQATAKFAQEIGVRNFNIPFQPLSSEDTLGKALINMRDNLRSGDERLNEAQHIARLGSWEWNVKNNNLFWSDELFKIYDLDQSTFSPNYDLFLNFIHQEDRDEVNTVISNCLADHKPFSYECRVTTVNGVLKTIFTQGRVSLNSKKEIIKLYGITQDITERKKAEANLEIKNKELERKNKELEQFAFVASHDLQEPLKTTISFVDLFKKQYFGKLDAKADKYLDYISQASDRMRMLITDLLDFSRIGHNKALEQVDCNTIFQNVMSDLYITIEDSDAEIKAENLPFVRGYATELKQLFQNLILNSIKFRKKNIIPKINITARKKKDFWEFAFTDNGIGIDKQHYEKIFIIFQRLHTRSEYQGTGIGLSHCKKIVELHHGKIWVDSIPDEGSTFYFTIHSPKEKVSELKNKVRFANG